MHNIVFIATAHNTVYAFDADSFALLWRQSLRSPDDTDMNPPFSQTSCGSLSPIEVDVDAGKVIKYGIGIQATPVIDRDAGIISISYRILDPSNHQPHQHLVALDIRTGAKVNDVEISAPDFHLPAQRNRASLLLSDGIIYMAFGSRCVTTQVPLKRLKSRSGLGWCITAQPFIWL